MLVFLLAFFLWKLYLNKCWGQKKQRVLTNKKEKEKEKEKSIKNFMFITKLFKKKRQPNYIDKTERHQERKKKALNWDLEDAGT